MDKIYYSLKPKDESEESDITEIDINSQTTILTITTNHNYYINNLLHILAYKIKLNKYIK